MNLLDKIKTIMTDNLETLHPEDELRKVKEIFESHNIHHIPIVEFKKLVGIVSKSDYLFFSRGFNGEAKDKKLERFRLSNYRVKDLMTTGLATLAPDDKINVALEIFKENLFHAIPVVENENLVGIVTTLDIIKNLAEDKGAINEYD